MPKRALSLLSIAAAIFALSLSSAHASSFSSVIVFGDSLSDNGNLYAATGLPASPPYDNGRFSNGPVAVEQLAAQLGAPLLDFAYGGATTGIGNIGDGGTQTSVGTYGLPGITTEFNGAKIPSSLLATSLVVVWGGADDFESQGSPLTAASNIDKIVASLEQEGATSILVPGLPNIGLTPEFYMNPLATDYTNAFNTALLAGLPTGATYVDTDALLTAVTNDPSRYGFSNTNTACFDQTTLTLCSNPDSYLFFDDIHPNAVAQTLIADQLVAAVNPTSAVTPEPSSLILLGTGLLVTSCLLFRRTRAH